MTVISLLIQIYDFLKKHYSIILGIIFALLLCLNAFIYYQYVYSVTKIQTKPVIEKVIINQEIFDKILSDIDEREETLLQAKTKHYTDPFNN